MPYTGDKKREYQRQWIAKRRAAYMADKSCLFCGSVDNLSSPGLHIATA